MDATWQTRTQCRKCSAPLRVSLDAGESAVPGLAVFYCPACGERTQVAIPAGYDPKSISVTPHAE